MTRKKKPECKCGKELHASASAASTAAIRALGASVFRVLLCPLKRGWHVA